MLLPRSTGFEDLHLRWIVGGKGDQHLMDRSYQPFPDSTVVWCNWWVETPFYTTRKQGILDLLLILWHQSPPELHLSSHQVCSIVRFDMLNLTRPANNSPQSMNAWISIQRKGNLMNKWIAWLDLHMNRTSYLLMVLVTYFNWAKVVQTNIGKGREIRQDSFQWQIHHLLFTGCASHIPAHKKHLESTFLANEFLLRQDTKVFGFLRHGRFM